MAEYASVSPRKLAAIMISDIHSFSQKMNENKEKALSLLKAYEGLMGILTLRFSGKMVKSVGDFYTIDFSSSVNAVQCALEAQQRLWSYNKDRDASSHIEIRIGIHTGDVLVQNNEIVGDAIQIASLIEALAEPNRILISSDVYQQVKNTIPLNVYSLGKLKLKNIPDPIEIFEVLMDSIPELSAPSKSATLFHERHSIDQAIHKREEEAKEAQRVEEIRRQSIQEQKQKEEEHKKALDELYQKAEAHMKHGNLDEAEKTLEMIEARRSDSPSAQTQTSYASLMEPKAREIHERLNRAKQFLNEGKLGESESELNKIFELEPLHVEAQQILLYIEEQRYKKEQVSKETQQQENTFLDPTQQKISDLLTKVRNHIQKEELQEARYTIREIYHIDPNHYAARQLEEEIRTAEEKRSERLRLQATQKEERDRQWRLEQLRNRLDEKRKQQARKVKEPTHKSFTIPWKSILIAFGIVIVLGIIIYFRDNIFPSTKSIAILPLNGETARASQSPINKALPYLLSYDFASQKGSTVLNPTTTMLFERSGDNVLPLARFLNVRYLLVGSTSIIDSSYTISFKLIDAHDSTIVNSFTTAVTATNIGEMRSKILRNIDDAIGIKAPMPNIRWTNSSDAAIRYLFALSLVPTMNTDILQRCGRLCEAAFMNDQTFCYASRDAAQFYYQLYELEGDPQYVTSAAQNLQKALSCSPNDMMTRLLQAKSLRLSNKVKDAKILLDNIALSEPSISLLYQEQAYIALMQNRQTDAIQYAKKGLILDPKNPWMSFVLGLSNHNAKMYEEALLNYETAIKLGYPERLLTDGYRSYVWLQSGKAERCIQYYRTITEKSLRDYAAFYKIGQAYQHGLKITDAEEWLTKGLKAVQDAIAYDPEDARAHAYAALFFSRLGKFSDGEIEIQKAIELAPADPEILYKAAETYCIQKEKEKSLDYIRKAYSLRYNFGERFNIDLATIASSQEFISAITF